MAPEHGEQTASAPTAAAFFISYTQADQHWAEWIAWQLESAGYSVRIQAWDFGPGDNFVLQMDKASAESSRTIAVLSSAYLASRYGQAEWAAAFAADASGGHKKLLPIRVEDVVPPGLLRQLVRVDLFDCDEQTARMRLLEAAKAARRKPSTSPAFPAPIPTAPFLKPTFPSPLPAIWNVPPRNRNFTGRQAWLDRLRTDISVDQRTVVTQTVAGLGGIGKSQLAIEFAYRNATSYPLVWWVRAETHESRFADLLALARRTGYSASDESPVDAPIAHLEAWLQSNPGWLLIFDNAETPDDIAELIPHAGSGHVLITSRFSAWGSIAKVVKLGLWAPDEAVQYLSVRTGQSDEAAARLLADTLGHLPLAIEQAAAYVDESQIDLKAYTDLFLRAGWKLLTVASTKATVATLWSVSLKAVRQQSTDAVTLLQLAAFLPPDSFPRRRLRRPAAMLPHPLTSVLGDDMALNDAVAVLRRYSLIEATPHHISVHRLVQVVVQESLSSSERDFFAVAAHRIQHGTDEALNEWLPENTVQPSKRMAAVRHWVACRFLWLSGPSTRRRRLVGVAAVTSAVFVAGSSLIFDWPLRLHVRDGALTEREQTPRSPQPRATSLISQQNEAQIHLLPPSAMAQKTMDRVIKAAGLQSNFTLQASPDISNVVATVNDGQRLIIYNEDFFIKRLAEVTWSGEAMFAHEVGHHIMGHALSTNRGDIVEQELEADRFAGVILARLGASVGDARAIFKFLPEDRSNSRPSLSARTAALLSGWNQAKGLR